MDTEMRRLIFAIEGLPWESSEFYREYLGQTYHYVLHSCRMLAFAASRTKDMGFFRRAVKHIGEENGHEKLALIDLSKMGSSIANHPESGVTRAFWEAQFYKIGEQPSALLGYVVALEYLAACVGKDLQLRATTAHGADCANFLRVHAEDDPDHVDKAIEQIESLSETERIEVWKNFEQTCLLYGLLLQDCAERAKRKRTGSGANDVRAEPPRTNPGQSPKGRIAA